MQEANNLALNSIRMKNTRGVLVFTFERLYTLRNQIFHGGSTYNSSANRAQLKDGCDILSKIVPVIIQVMIDNPSTVDWGKPFYPYIMQESN